MLYNVVVVAIVFIVWVFLVARAAFVVVVALIVVNDVVDISCLVTKTVFLAAILSYFCKRDPPYWQKVTNRSH